MNELRIGMVGLDTTHCSHFARILNDEHDPYHIGGGKITAAVRAGNPDLELSAGRLDKFTDELTGKYNVALYDSIAAMMDHVDAVCLESVDGAQHLAQFTEMAASGKPVFIDKPLACSSADAKAIAALAYRYRTPIMSCSALRYAAGQYELHDAGDVLSAEAFGPTNLRDDYPAFFWYGVHPADILFSYMGADCRRVRAVASDTADLIVGEWADGRIGTLRGFRDGPKPFGVSVATADGVRTGICSATPPYYQRLLQQVVTFMQEGLSPIPVAEMVAVVAFLEAAEISKQRAGLPIELDI